MNCRPPLVAHWRRLVEQFSVDTSGKMIGEAVLAFAPLAQHPGEVLDVRT